MQTVANYSTAGPTPRGGVEFYFENYYR